MKKPEPKEYVIQPKGWKKKYKCHKNKGDHTFKLVYVQHFTILGLLGHDIYITKECSACGKKSTEVEAW